jgi:hypothetical protein
MNSLNSISDKQTELYVKYAPLIFNRCRRFLRSDDEAQEAAGDVFRDLARAWEAMDGAKDDEGARRWIDRTTARMRLEEIKRVRCWILGSAALQPARAA